MQQPGKVYALGYANPMIDQKLHEAMTDPRCLLIDIRYRPISRWRPEWRKSTLQATWGTRYIHMQPLGNINYHTPELPIQLADPTECIKELAQLLQSGTSLVLLCACKNYDTCHRRTVVNLLNKAVPNLEVIQ
ncbi:DUF488 family protein, N3 subclade [Dictyobacter aurantiacus]|uniref:DUF488 domain-containing protein n=1 Tax=Dictyobacter aurantiacus TaxID=1936993 RepID=A0A401ZGY7_9CHLR|nr:DUF488 family protein [Dictyobacter aurantiacus]GCE06151.1 hypothetical protein KDAU_34800 [Dictyobacter aurantiacus]